MKLLALAAVMMVSGTMVGQQIDPNKADDKPSYFIFSNMPVPADAPKNAHEYALRSFKEYREYRQSKHMQYAGNDIVSEMNFVFSNSALQSVSVNWDGTIELHGITVEDAFLVEAAFKLEDQMRLEKEWDRQEKVREEESQHNPPPSIKAGSGKYKVTPVHQLPTDVLANTQCTTKQINVLIDQDAKRTSVMHEMMHVASNCDESVHRAIYELAGPLLKLLQDNPDMADYLLKRAKPAAPPVAIRAWQPGIAVPNGIIDYDDRERPTIEVRVFDFNSPGPIAWKDPYYVKYKSGWMCTRELVEKRDTICFRMLESFHWEWFDCEKDSVVCRDVKK